MQARALFVILVFGLAALAGCASKKSDDDRDSEVATGLVPVNQRYLQPYRVDGDYSYTLENGTYEILAGIPVDVPVSLPPTEGLPAATGATDMHLGLFLPKIPGCDWSAAELPAKCHVPVVADAGPYYASSRGIPDLQTEGDTIAEEPAHRLGGFLIENLVPHGYAVAQISVFGTGDSGHCMDLMGTAEQLGLDAAVTWLGTQPWSNGKVALTGRSYDGSTPWEAAMFGNPYLASIVPISGLTSQYDLMYHNGSAETRGPGVLYGLYAAMTIDGDASDSQQALCPDYLLGAPQGVRATVTGDPTTADPYWSERIFLDRALANYDGSIYMIHGLQDWNVEPHMAFPAYNLFEAKGNEVKALLGQWGHMYPDRPSEHAGLDSGRGEEAFPYSVRYDWAQDMLEWFDYTLKGTGPKPDLHVEVQDNQGFWRIESTWPPVGTQLDLDLPAPVAGGANPPGAFQISETSTVRFDLGPIGDGEVRIAGLPQLDLLLAPTGPGGQVYALLEDSNGLHLGHAILDLRFPDGTRSPQPVLPAVVDTWTLEFEPMDVVLKPGTSLVLTLSGSGEDYLPSEVAAPVQLWISDTPHVLRLPIVTPAAGQFFTPPVWSGVAEAGAPQP